MRRSLALGLLQPVRSAYSTKAGGPVPAARICHSPPRLPAQAGADQLAGQPALASAVNVAFFDGHGELVKLDRLWQLYWHKDYQPPAKRPGLP